MNTSNTEQIELFSGVSQQWTFRSRVKAGVHMAALRVRSRSQIVYLFSVAIYFLINGEFAICNTIRRQRVVSWDMRVRCFTSW